MAVENFQSRRCKDRFSPSCWNVGWNVVGVIYEIMMSANFLTSGGLILAADYSQLELRILAHLSCDCRLIQALNGGTDVFKNIAAEWKMIDPEAVGDGTRQQAKQVIFRKKSSAAAFWAGRFSVQNIRESIVRFSVGVRVWLFSSCFVCPPTLNTFQLELSGFWGMRVEKSSMNGSDSEVASLFACSPLFPYTCLPVNHTLFWLCFLCMVHHMVAVLHTVLWQICYGIIYGIGAKSLGEQMGIDENEAANYIESFKSRYTGSDMDGSWVVVVFNPFSPCLFKS